MSLIRRSALKNSSNNSLWVRWFSAIFLVVVLVGGTVSPVRAQTSRQQPYRTGASTDESSTPVDAVPAKREVEHDEAYEFEHSAAVQKFGKFLGLNTEQGAIAFEIFNFLVLAVAVGYVLLKTLPKTFRARNTAIQKQLVDARTATEEANARLNSVEARLSKLDEQISGMRTQAEADGTRDEHRIRAGVEEEKAKILAATEADIHAATAMARREIQKFAAELAIEQAARKLVVTAETDRLLVESFARDLTGGSGGQN